MRYIRTWKMQNYKLQDILELASRDKNKLVKRTENRYKDSVIRVAKYIAKNNYSIVCVSGPSSSGKTTTSNIITKKLEEFGKSALVVSMDNFFINRLDTPLLPDGTRDYDNINAVNIELFKKCMDELIDTGSTNMPIYDFISGVRLDDACCVKIKSNTVIIVEGLHALNPMCISEKMKTRTLKMYVCPQSGFIQPNANITPETLRLTRRMVRDFYHRGHSVKDTEAMWKNVREKEDVFVVPYKADADFIIDTTHMYEPLLYEHELLNISQKDADALKYLNYYLLNSNFSKNYISKDSLIWEFLGI